MWHQVQEQQPQEDAPQEFMWGRGEIRMWLSVYIPSTSQAFAGIT
jgi:hypothetical protein